jgi:hypothetical protein
MKLSQLVEDRRELAIAVGSGSIVLGYNPSGVTPRMMAMADEAQKGNVGVATLCAMLAPMLVDWDVTDDDNNPLPLTADGLQDIPFGILVKIMTEIGEDISVPKAPSAPSDSGSSPEGVPVTLPQNISSFAPLDTSA